jgi:hypothetical protein
LQTSNLILDFEFDQHLESHKHVISIIMRFRDTGCYSRASHTEWAGVTESCHVKRRNSCMWLRPCCGYCATLEPSHTSVNGATEKSHIWKKSFGRFISRILFKKESKYQKKSFVCVQFYTQQYVLLPCLGPWDHYRKRHLFIGFFIFVGWPMNIRCHDHHIG